MVIILILLLALLYTCKMRKQDNVRTTKKDHGFDNSATVCQDEAQAEVYIELQQRPLPSSPRTYNVPRAIEKGDETEPSDTEQYYTVATERMACQDNT